MNKLFINIFDILQKYTTIDSDILYFDNEIKDVIILFTHLLFWHHRSNVHWNIISKKCFLRVYFF